MKYSKTGVKRPLQNRDLYHARIQEFSSGGGVQVNLTKKALTFFLVLSLFYRSQMVNFKENYHFQGSRGGPIFPGGGGGALCLFPIGTHITCDFPGGGGFCSPLWICTCLLQMVD